MTTNTTDSREPRTEAGKAYVSAWCPYVDAAMYDSEDELRAAESMREAFDRDIRAIEDEAAAEARAEAIQGQLEDISDIVAVKVAEARRELLAPDRIEQAAIRACVAHHDEEHVAMIPPCGGARRDAEWWAAAFRGEQR